MLRDTADDAATAVAGYVAVVAISEADRVFDAIADSTSAASTSDVYALCLSWEAAVESACKVLLTVIRRGAALTERIPRWRDALVELADHEAPDEAAEAAAEALGHLGIEGGVARSLLALERLHGVLQVVRVAEDRDIPLGDASELYRKVGGMLDFANLDRWFAVVPGEDRWDKRAAEALREDLAAARRRMTATIFAQPQKSLAVRYSTFLRAHEGELARLRGLIAEFAGRRQTSIAAMVVVVRELWKLAGRS